MKRLMLALALTLAATPALAHKLKVFAGGEGTTIVGTAYFAGGGKAANCASRLLAADGTLVTEFRTDAEGGFRLEVGQRQDYRVAVDSGDGHVAEARVAASELSSALPAGNSVATTSAAPVPPAVATTAAIPAEAPALDAVEAAVARQIVPLRQQIDAMEERARFSDIMGGIGTIFGVFGVAAWIAARRKRPQ